MSPNLENAVFGVWPLPLHDVARKWSNAKHSKNWGGNISSKNFFLVPVEEGAINNGVLYRVLWKLNISYLKIQILNGSFIFNDQIESVLKKPILISKALSDSLNKGDLMSIKKRIENDKTVFDVFVKVRDQAGRQKARRKLGIKSCLIDL